MTDFTNIPDKKWRKMDPPMLPPRNVKIQQETMKEVYCEANTHLDLWLVDGTLCTIYRDGKRQPYDQDTDFACRAEDLVEEIDALKDIFMARGYDVRAEKNNTRLNMWKNGEMVSLQGYVKKKKYPKYRFLKKNRVHVDYFEHENYLVFDGITYRVPWKIEKYLAMRYSNWKVPYTGNTKNKKYLNKRGLRVG